MGSRVERKRMRQRRSEFERIRAVLADAEADGPLTAREILRLLDDHGVSVESTHRIATVLGRRDGTDVEVIPDRPYRYQLRESESA